LGLGAKGLVDAPIHKVLEQLHNNLFHVEREWSRPR